SRARRSRSAAGSSARERSSTAASPASPNKTAAPRPNPSQRQTANSSASHSCPAVAVRDGQSVPTIGPGRRAAAPVVYARLLDPVGQQADEARALEGLGELALLFGRHRGDAAGHDLATLGDVATEQAHVLVVDLGRVIA